jgi:hypothetical protein
MMEHACRGKADDGCDGGGVLHGCGSVSVSGWLGRWVE